MSNLTVSVIVPTFNRKVFLWESLLSLIWQTHPPDQIVVVDDGSTESIAEIKAEIVKRWTEITSWKFVRQDTNQGKSVAVNRGLQYATGDLIWIWDDDDLADKRRLEKLIPIFEGDGDIGAVHTDAEWFSEDGMAEQWKAEDVNPVQVLRHKMWGNDWFTISVMFRRTLLDDLATLEKRYENGAAAWLSGDIDDSWPLDPRLERAQDYDLWIRLAWAMMARGKYHVRAINEKTVRARIHPGKRGIGHRLRPEEILKRTGGCEQIIFQKVFDRIPIGDIWPGYSTEPYRQVAHLERAFALSMRQIWDHALYDLRKVNNPELLSVLPAITTIRFLEAAQRTPWEEGRKELSRVFSGLPDQAIEEAEQILGIAQRIPADAKPSDKARPMLSFM